MNGFDRFKLRIGIRIIEWPNNVKLFHDGNGEFEDYLANSLGWIVVSESAKQLFEEEFRTQIQFLTVEVVDRRDNNKTIDYFVINILNSIPALNRERSVFKVLKDGQLLVVKPVLDANLIEDYDIFRLDEFKSQVYVSEKFKMIIENNKLTGINLKEAKIHYPFG